MRRSPTRGAGTTFAERTRTGTAAAPNSRSSATFRHRATAGVAAALKSATAYARDCSTSTADTIEAPVGWVYARVALPVIVKRERLGLSPGHCSCSSESGTVVLLHAAPTSRGLSAILFASALSAAF